jgi:transcriptional regulator with XRE-family HTH domain
VGATYADVLTRNIRTARAAKRLGQANVVARMRALGFTAWHRQTVGKIERGERRVLADELLGLALTLETSIGALMAPSHDDKQIALPSGVSVLEATVRYSIRYRNDGSVRWEGDTPHFIEPAQELSTSESLDAQSRGFEPLRRGDR